MPLRQVTVTVLTILQNISDELTIDRLLILYIHF